MTVVYGPEDAIYGTGQYSLARYGSVGPTKQVTGVLSSFSIGTLGLIGDAAQTLLGYQLTSSLRPLILSGEASKTFSGESLQIAVGEVSVKSINRIEVLGVSSLFALGNLTAEGGVGYTAVLDSLPLELTLGTAKPNLVTFVQGIPATITLNPTNTSGKANLSLQGNPLSIEEGTTSTVAVVVDFGMFAENYSNKRTVYIPKTHIPEVA